MPIVSEIEKAIFEWAPKELAEDWDNVGLLCGSAEQEVTRLLVALDPFENVCLEAAERGAQLIVTHHPLIFVPPHSVTDRDSVGRCIMFLASHGISAINAHTNLDCAFGGVNDILANKLGLKDIHVIGMEKRDSQNRICGLLRAGSVEETDIMTFAQLVKETLSCPGIRLVDAGRPVRRVAVGGGACGSELVDVSDANCDTFVTADVKYNQFRDAVDLGVNLIDAGHFETENPVCKALAAFLRERFPTIEVLLSEKHSDPIKYLI
ncbi:MAG: Nif3-like dinuclear metal center hexameric protein [Oscillospiraceae bacterium]|nr:Nif3-like dinuclear metal center hexameric protein [Oscillospiraceae bacterium]